MSSSKYFQIDAFTKTKFSGNPAGVVFCGEKWPEKIAEIASETNQTETAFIKLKNKIGKNYQDDAEFDLKWFTPTREVPLCGHATLAAAGALFLAGNLNQSITFDTLSGPLIANKTEGGFCLDFPIDEINDVSFNPDDFLVDDLSDVLTEVLTVVLSEHLFSKIKRVKLGQNTKKLLVEINNLTRSELESINIPDGDTLKSFHDGKLFKGICITGRTDESDEFLNQYDVISRYFAPWNGIPEDHVTGSLHTALLPFYQQEYEDLRQKKIIEFRQHSKRGGDLSVSCNEKKTRVYISGSFVKVLSGVLE